MSIKDESYYKEIVEKNLEYEFISLLKKGDTLLNGKVINRNIYLRVKHIECGNVYDVRNDAFIKMNQRCKICFMQKQKQQVKKEMLFKINNISEITQGEYIGIGFDIKSNKKYIKVKHTVCGYEFLTTHSRIKNGIGCRKCTKPNFKTDEEIYEEYSSKFQDLNLQDYRLLNVYRTKRTDNKGHRIRLTVEHLNCGNIYNVDAISFINYKSRCRECSFEKNKVSKDEFLIRAKKAKVFPLEEYIRTDVKILVKCMNERCNNQWYTTPNSILNLKGCPKCNVSKGERKISYWLDSFNVNYLHDKPCFKDLLSDKGYPLRPDFILPKYKIWIEYDGEFHYENIFEDDKYKYQKKNDIKKNEYAKKHGWKMIRIPYWEFDNIENILEKNIALNINP